MQLSNYEAVGEPDLQNLPTDCHTDEADDAKTEKDKIKKYAKEIYMILSYKNVRILQKLKRKLLANESPWPTCRCLISDEYFFQVHHL